MLIEKKQKKKNYKTFDSNFFSCWKWSKFIKRNFLRYPGVIGKEKPFSHLMEYQKSISIFFVGISHILIEFVEHFVNWGKRERKSFFNEKLQTEMLSTFIKSWMAEVASPNPSPVLVEVEWFQETLTKFIKNFVYFYW